MANGLLRIGDIAGFDPPLDGGAQARVHHKLEHLHGFEFYGPHAEQKSWKVQRSEAWRSQVISKDYWPREQGPKRQKHPYVVVLRESLRYLWGAIP
jgi:hypothetical protein